MHEAIFNPETRYLDVSFVLNFTEISEQGRRREFNDASWKLTKTLVKIIKSHVGSHGGIRVFGPSEVWFEKNISTMDLEHVKSNISMSYDQHSIGFCLVFSLGFVELMTKHFSDKIRVGALNIEKGSNNIAIRIISKIDSFIIDGEYLEVKESYFYELCE